MKKLQIGNLKVLPLRKSLRIHIKELGILEIVAIKRYCVTGAILATALSIHHLLSPDHHIQSLNATPTLRLKKTGTGVFCIDSRPMKQRIDVSITLQITRNICTL